MKLFLGDEILNPQSVLRINIDNTWYLNDFENLFNSIKTLYRINLIENIHLQRIEFSDRNNLQDLLDEFKIDNLEVYKKIANPIFKEYFSIGLSSDLFFGKPTVWNKNLYDLKVKQIQYASPGFGDFVGLGEIFKNITDTFKYYFPNKKEKLEAQITEVELIQKKVDLYKSMGLTNNEVRELVFISETNKQNIINLINSTRVTDIQNLDYENEQNE